LFARFCLHVPLPLTLAAAGLFLLKQHASGAAFRHDQAHQIFRFIDLLLLLAVSGAALLTAGIIFACTRCRLTRGTRWAAGVGAVLALAAVVLAFAASESIFQRAKARAYAAVNAAALRADCAAMAAAPGPFVTAGEKYFGGTPGRPALHAFTATEVRACHATRGVGDHADRPDRRRVRRRLLRAPRADRQNARGLRQREARLRHQQPASRLSLQLPLKTHAPPGSPGDR
jgi:hypothetical protein